MAQTNLNSQGRRMKMNKVDYDRALYYTHRSEWDNLLILMVRTSDQFLAKKSSIFYMRTILKKITRLSNSIYIHFYVILITPINYRKKK